MKLLVVTGWAVILAALVGEWQNSIPAGIASGVFLMGLNEIVTNK